MAVSACCSTYEWQLVLGVVRLLAGETGGQFVGRRNKCFSLILMLFHQVIYTSSKSLNFFKTLCEFSCKVSVLKSLNPIHQMCVKKLFLSGVFGQASKLSFLRLVQKLCEFDSKILLLGALGTHTTNLLFCSPAWVEYDCFQFRGADF